MTSRDVALVSRDRRVIVVTASCKVLPTVSKLFSFIQLITFVAKFIELNLLLNNTIYIDVIIEIVSSST